MADEPKKPPVDPPTPIREREREGGLATRDRPKVERPKRFKVILFNDDYTTKEFVEHLLETVFGKSPLEAHELMMQIHKGGMGVAGVYVLEIAETKVATVHRMAEEHGFPLRAASEPE